MQLPQVQAPTSFSEEGGVNDVDEGATNTTGSYEVTTTLEGACPLTQKKLTQGQLLNCRGIVRSAGKKTKGTETRV